jgi:Tfp pilus assembly PilM family ATPase
LRQNYKKLSIFAPKYTAMEQRTVLNEAQLSVLRLLATMNSVEEVQELRQIISNYYAQKATEEMDKLWESGEWSEEKNEAVLKEHLRTPYSYAQ